MATTFTAKPPLSFWIIAALLTLWGIAGCFAAYMQIGMSQAELDALGEPDRTIMGGLPGWFGWVYAGAVGFGLAGSVALLLRRAIAQPLYLLSLVCVVIQFGYVFIATDMLALKGAAATVPFPLFIVAVALFQIWYVGQARARGWIA